MRSMSVLLTCLLALASCSSPPKPPTADESTRRPANSAMGVEMQTCRSDLQNTRLVATEATRRAETAEATVANLSMRQQLLAAMQPSVAGSRIPPAANRVHSVRFDFGSSQVAIQSDIAATLVEDAKAAPLVLLRGRTDGETDATAEGRIARARSEAVRDWLVASGVDPARIRTTWQPSGDRVADNASASGRSLNRRVEIEVYRTLPVALAASSPRP